MTDTPAFASTREALGALRAAMGYLAAADATAMAAGAQAECLLALEEMTAVQTAARAAVLGAFTAAQKYSADGDCPPRLLRPGHRPGRLAGYPAAHRGRHRRRAAGI